MGETEPQVGHPLEAQRVGVAVGTALLGMIAVSVALVVDGEPAELMVLLVVGLVVWTVILGLSRVLSRTPVVRDAGIRRIAGPVDSDWSAAFAVGLRATLVVNGATWGVGGLAFWALGSLNILPIIVLGLAGQFVVEVVDLRRWQAELGVVLHTTASSRRLRLVGPRNTEELVAVVVESPVESRVSR